MKVGLLAAVMLTAAMAPSLAQAPSTAISASPAAGPTLAQVGVKDAVEIATDAYIFGYSLITTHITRKQMSNVPAVGAGKAPLNQFYSYERYPSADYRAVSAPNADTLYSIAWLDLAEPQVFTHPDMGKRFYLFPLTDLWMTDFASRGARTAGQKAANYLITGPGWKGEVPPGLQHIPVATRYTVILGRTYADGTEADYKAANALQAQYKITPLSAWGKPFTPKAPPVDPNPGFSMTDKPQAVILAMGTEAYFNMMTKLMWKEAPPYAADGPMLQRMAKIGIEPGKPFELAKLNPAAQAALKDLPEVVLKKLGANLEAIATKANGWLITGGLGAYGTDYLKRASIAAFGWPANADSGFYHPLTLAPADATSSGGGGAGDEAASTEQLAKDAQNPVAKLISVPLQNNFNFGVGPNDGTQWVLNVQPVIPITLNEDWNLITRTILPIINQPSPARGVSSASGMGDINETLFLSPAKSGKLIWGAGPFLTFPAATDPMLGAGKWCAGPSVVALTMQGHWVVGALVNQSWSYAGWGDKDVSAMLIQPFVNYNFCNCSGPATVGRVIVKLFERS